MKETKRKFIPSKHFKTTALGTLSFMNGFVLYLQLMLTGQKSNRCKFQTSRWKNLSLHAMADEAQSFGTCPGIFVVPVVVCW